MLLLKVFRVNMLHFYIFIISKSYQQRKHRNNMYLGDVKKLIFLLRNISLYIYPTKEALFAACRFDHIEIVKLFFNLFPYRRERGIDDYLIEALAISMEKTRLFLFDNVFKKCKLTDNEFSTRFGYRISEM